MRAGYGEALRDFLATKTNPTRLIDFAGHKIFDSATVDVNILTYEKGENKGETSSCTIKENHLDNLSVHIQQNSSINRFVSKASWTILTPLESRIKNKIERIGVPLKEWDIRINYGVKTGLNDVFIITKNQRDELIKADPKSAEIIRPILRGRDIKRYSSQFSNLWVINTHNGIKDSNIPPIDIIKYPAIKAYLDQYYPLLEKRQDKGITPYHLRSCAYMDDFSKQKIAWGNLCLNAQYAWIEDSFFVNNPANIIVPGDKYLLGALNSKIADFYIRNLGVTRNGGYFEYKPMFVEKLPIPLLSEAEKQPFIEVVEQILLKKADNIDTQNDEQILDEMFYHLYQLSSDETSFLARVSTSSIVATSSSEKSNNV